MSAARAQHPLDALCDGPDDAHLPPNAGLPGRSQPTTPEVQPWITPSLPPSSSATPRHTPAERGLPPGAGLIRPPGRR